MHEPVTLGVDLGGTNLRVGVVDGRGEVHAELRAPTPRHFDDVVTTVARLAAQLRSQTPEADRLGVGAAGMIDGDGVVWYAPNVPAFAHAPLRDRLAATCGVPVAVDNDANVAALGELTYGAAMGLQHALVVTLGTGIGGGLILGGRVYRGAHGFAAEIGHFQVDPDGPVCACGERGHWEALASGAALGRMGRERAAAGAAPGVLARAGGEAAAVTGVTVSEAAAAGDRAALAILRDYADQVAIGLAGLTNVLDPQRIVVSGGLVALGDLLLAPVRASFARRIEAPDDRPPVEIVAARLGERAGVVGAAVLARGG